MLTKTKIQKHSDFARRLSETYDKHPSAPPKNYGQLGWIVEHVSERTGEKVAPETARKWLAGESFPRSRAMEALADLLGIKSGWLAYGDGEQKNGKFDVEASTKQNSSEGRGAISEESVTISISKRDFERLKAIGQGLFTAPEIIRRLLDNLTRS